LGLVDAFLLSLSFLAATSVKFGFGSGNGMCLPAAIMSSSRGSSMTNRPGL
jgi:hypothetical protein